MKTVAKIKGLELKAQAATEGSDGEAPGAAELYVYGDIVTDKWFEDDVAAGEFVKALASIEAESISVNINSGGGSVFAGVAIYNALKRHSAPINVNVDGLAASIASVIAMAGNTVTMAENAVMMIHSPWSMTVGNSTEHRKMADTLDTVRDAMLSSYDRTGLSSKQLKDMMDAETWMTADEAVGHGFADKITEMSQMAASVLVPGDRYQHAPERFTLGKKEGIEMPAAKKPAAPAEPTGTTPGEVAAQVQAAKEEAAAEAQAAALASEQRRRDEVSAMFAKFPHLNDLRQKCMEDMSCSVDKSKDLLMDSFASSPAEPLGGSRRIETTEDEHAKFIEAAVDGHLMRVGIIPMDHSNPYRGFGMQDMARACVERRGQSTARMSRDDIIKAAIEVRADFPVLYENLMHKALMTAYRNAPFVADKFCSTGDLNDFRPHNRYRLGSFKDLGTLAEAVNPIPDTDLDDGEQETIQATEHGYIYRLSYAMIIDDDLQAFTNIATGMGRAARRTVENAVFTALTSNSGAGPAMGDTYNLFDSLNRGTSNIGTAGVISVASVSEARTLMRRHTDLSGNDYFDILPAILLCPPELSGLARQVIHSETDWSGTTETGAGNPAKANPVRDIVEVVDTPRLTGTRWYLIASPNDVPMMEIGYLRGQTEPDVRLEEGFDTRSMHYRVTLDFGVAPLEWRSGVSNAGA